MEPYNHYFKGAYREALAALGTSFNKSLDKYENGDSEITDLYADIMKPLISLMVDYRLVMEKIRDKVTIPELDVFLSNFVEESFNQLVDQTEGFVKKFKPPGKSEAAEPDE